MRLRLMLCVLVIALVSTRSRMGNTAFFSSMVIAGLIGLALSRHATRGTVALLVSLIAIDLFIVGSWFGVEKLAQRLEQTTLERRIEPHGEESVEQRSEAARYGLNIVGDYPAFGTGPGSWYAAFPRYRGADLQPFFDEAHNDYVQFLAENGLVGFGLLSAIALWSIGVALKAQYQRRDPLMRGLAFASIMGITAILIHASVDFNLQIPSNAIMFIVLFAFGWIALYLDRRPPPAEVASSPQPP
jgi:O-antigen ligase